MRIVIDPFDKRSIANAEKLVKQYSKDFKVKSKLFVQRLAEIGVQVAQAGFATATYDGVNEVVVSLVPTATGVSVVASGETVGFIEFGTGVRYPEWNNGGLTYTPPAHGTYGQGKGAQSWGWWYRPADGGKGVHTYGNPPAEAMRTARDEMVARVIQIAREVWR